MEKKTNLTKAEWPFISPAAKKFINDFFSGGTSTGEMTFDPWSETTTYKEGEYQITEVEVPGIPKDKITATYNDYDGMVTILGDADGAPNTPTRRVKRVVFIGYDVDDKLIESTLDNGVLKLKYKTGSDKTSPKRLKIG